MTRCPMGAGKAAKLPADDCACVDLPEDTWGPLRGWNFAASFSSEGGVNHMHVVFMLYTCCMHVVCTLYARCMHVVCTLHACCMHIVCMCMHKSIHKFGLGASETGRESGRELRPPGSPGPGPGYYLFFSPAVYGRPAHETGVVRSRECDIRSQESSNKKSLLTRS